ncbi:MAG: glycosyltransferase family 39 protein [Dehalococcoidia bacterium]|nr:glycosyltransferase family 39 protein [Dehalococcoidia bacterium]
MSEAMPPAANEHHVPLAPVLRWVQVVPVLPLLAALLASVVAYWPALQSPLYADDYLYLNAARNLSFSDIAMAAFTPLSEEPLLAPVTSNYWRPLHVLSFELLEPLFGGNPSAYHVFLLGIHLASVVLVWLLARQLSGRWETAGIAAVLFAAHPAPFEGVAWIASSNNAGLPLMLAAWLFFARATERERLRWRGLIVSALLLAAALGFRESTLTVVPAIAAWRCLWWRRDRLRERSTYAPFLPFVIVLAVYEVVRTRFLTEPAITAGAWGLGDHIPGQFWFYLKVVAFPVSEGATGSVHWAQVTAGAAISSLAPGPACAPSLAHGCHGCRAVLRYHRLCPADPRRLAALRLLPRRLRCARRGRCPPRTPGLCPPLYPSTALMAGCRGRPRLLLLLGSAAIHRRTAEWVEAGPTLNSGGSTNCVLSTPSFPREARSIARTFPSSSPSSTM